MHVVRFATLDELAPLAAEWDRLSAGVPFRSWAWNSCWWRNYGPPGRDAPRRELYVLGVFDHDGKLLGIAPWYLEPSLTKGRVVRFLGSGEVCSEYLSLLVEPGREPEVLAAVASWLGESATADLLPDLRCDRWDLLDLQAVDAEDAVIGNLAAALEQRSHSVFRQPGWPCWRAELPNSWDEFQARLAGRFRRRLRAFERRFADGTVVTRCIQSIDDLAAARANLVLLHQRRRRQLGQAGCFASSRFTDFHDEVMPQLVATGQFLMTSIEIEGRTVAVDYGFPGRDGLYCYQAGIEPEALQHSPGHMSHYVLFRRAIERGARFVDFLRGNEPYKADWAAEPRPTLELRIVPPRIGARLRHGLWRTGKRVKHWIKKLRKAHA